MLKFTSVLLLQCFLFFTVIAQQAGGQQLKFELSVPAAYNLSAASNDQIRIELLMQKNAAAGQVLPGISIYSFHQKFPGSHYLYLRNIYELTCADKPLNTAAVLSLQASDPTNFKFIRQVPLVQPLGTYTPNDYHGIPGADCTSQLDYINATTAWGVTKGNPAITIGINDPSGFDTRCPDLVGKIVGIDSTNIPAFHGTIVAGCAAANTDNGIGVAAIGFNCSLYLDSRGGNEASLSMSNRGFQVINNSWFYGNDCTETFEPGFFINDELVYDEVYENGTTTCFAAGNGLSGGGHCPSIFGYTYPCVLDHIITVGPVGHQNPLGTYANFNPATFPPGGIPWLWKDCHEESPGNSIGQFETLNYEANDRVDISAPAYNIASTDYDPNDSSRHYTSAASGTSFATPIVAGTVGLMLSANPCLSPYQVEYLLKKSARNIDYVEYPAGSGINLNASYVGKMGAGALDAGAAVTAASKFDCNDTSTQTLYIKGIELNTICAPGYSAGGVNPVMQAIIENGTPPYTYRWDVMPENNSVLSDYSVANPTIISGDFAQYHLVVYDNSPVRKEASRIIQFGLTTEETPLLDLRDGYMDMTDGPDRQAEIDGYNWQIWLSPDVVNRLQDDHVFINQNAVYAPGVPNYANARVRNMGCVASTGNEELNMYWTKAGTAPLWPGDWTTGTFTNSAGNVLPMGGAITNGGLHIPAILPGNNVLLSAPWYPPNPIGYDPLVNTVEVSLLGRIQTTVGAPYGMDIPEGVNTVANIANNNKIALHSLVVNNVAGGAIQWHQVILANTENYDRQFTLEFGSDRDFNPSFSGDISAYANVEIEPGVLYDRWVNGGSQGNNIQVDGKNKSVLYTGDGKIILKGITMHANEKIAALAGIFVTRQPLTDQYFNIRQWADSVTGHNLQLPYGDVSFLIPGCKGDTGCSTYANPNTSDVSILSRINVFPNPTSGILSILYTGYDENTLTYSITDLSGQKLFQQNAVNVAFGIKNSLDISAWSDGVYVLKISDRYNNRAAIKVVKN